MFTRRKAQAMQDMQTQPSILEATGSQHAIQQAESSSAGFDESSDALSPRKAASKGLGQIFLLQPRAAVLTIMVDLMVCALDTASLETLLPLGIGIAAVLGFIVYRIQRSGGDDHSDALTKSLIVGLLTAIPAPITPLFAIPSGLVGIVKAIRRRKLIRQATVSDK